MKYIGRLLAVTALYAGTTIVGAMAGGTARAQEAQYPNKPVRFVTASVGSPQDVIGRLIGTKLAETWGQPVVVDNRPGAGSLVSITVAAKAPADGYTLLLSSSAFTVTPSLQPNAGYNAEKDFIPVVLMASTPNLLIANPALGIKTLKDAVARAKSEPLNYGSPGAGTTPQLSAEYVFKSLAKVPATHVPYSGAAPAVTATAGGQVQVASVAMPAAVQLVKAGKLQGLAVTSARRASALPDVPTIAEAGFAGFEDSTWVGLWAPAGTPAAVTGKINAAVVKLLADPDVREKIATLGFETMGGSAQEFAAYQKQELAKWAKVVKETGAKAE
jgi:tripartite-type tricarboxylate transporter receptor subunit TctC